MTANDFITIGICPRCQQRFIRSPFSGDYNHDCPPNVASEALANEEILVIGAWQDYTGSDANPKPQALIQGQENTLQGTRAGIEGDKFQPVTSRGYPARRFRTRRHIEHITTDQLSTKKLIPKQPETYEADGFK